MRRRYQPDLFPDPFSASILGSATPKALHRRVERPKHPNHKAMDKSGGYSKPFFLCPLFLIAEVINRYLKGGVHVIDVQKKIREPSE
jgi:hypothetical protein